MSNSVLSSLANLLDRRTINAMADRIGESEDSVSRGLRPVFAAILGGIVNKTNDLGGLREIFDLILDAPADALTAVNLGHLASGGAAASPLFDVGRRLLSMIFGGNQGAVAEAIGQKSGLSLAAAARMMAMAAPMVIGVLGKRVRDEGMVFSGFRNLLQSESVAIRSYLPEGLSSLWTAARNLGGVPQSVKAPMAGKEDRSFGWVLPVCGLVVLLLGFFSLVRQGNGDANTNATRARTTVPGLGKFIDRPLPGNIRLHIPDDGVEAKLLSFLEHGSPGESEMWFEFDRLNFDAGSAIPTPESEEQLQNIASILKAYPNVRLRIGGYTGDAGDSKANLRLSENRAQSVKRELVTMGIAAERLEAEGYAERAKKSRISMRVLRK